MQAVHLIGLCQGETFATCYASLNPDRVATLVTAVTAINFHTKSDILSNLFRYVDLIFLRNVPKVIDGSILNFLFISLKPYSLLQKKYFQLIERSDDKDFIENYLRMEKWIFDSRSISTKTCLEFVEKSYRKICL